MIKNTLFQCITMFTHAICAWNTGGEGIHSPRLFYLVRYLFYDTSRFYAWDAIEQRRQAMLRAPKVVHIEDYGTGNNRDALVMQIARSSLMGSKQAQMLARLVNYMSSPEYCSNRHSPLRIVELGTSLGITTAYLASVGSANEVTSFEGSPEIAAMAQLNWNKLQLNNIHLVLGNIDDTLYNNARVGEGLLDFVLIDANHTGEAAMRYFEFLADKMSEDGILVMDDIRYSPSMYQAWRCITKHPKVTASMDLGRMGMVFFYPNVPQKTFILRI